MIWYDNIWYGMIRYDKISYGMVLWYDMDRKLGNPSDDISILCWDLEALPTHHLPWAGFGFRQSHWLIMKARFHQWWSRMTQKKIRPL